MHEHVTYSIYNTGFELCITTPLRKKKKINVKNYPLDEMLPLETKQSGGKLLPHSDLRGGCF